MVKMRAKLVAMGLIGGTLLMLPLDAAQAEQVGHASWYALRSRTASGEMMNPSAMTAAHRSLPFGTKVLVENLNNGRSVVVRINDRGPFIKGRIIDVSKAAASSLGMVGSGTARVRVSRVGGGKSSAKSSGKSVAGAMRGASEARRTLAQAKPSRTLAASTKRASRSKGERRSRDMVFASGRDLYRVGKSSSGL